MFFKRHACFLNHMMASSNQLCGVFVKTSSAFSIAGFWMMNRCFVLQLICRSMAGNINYKNNSFCVIVLIVCCFWVKPFLIFSFSQVSYIFCLLLQNVNGLSHNKSWRKLNKTRSWQNKYKQNNFFCLKTSSSGNDNRVETPFICIHV